MEPGTEFRCPHCKEWFRVEEMLDNEKPPNLTKEQAKKWDISNLYLWIRMKWKDLRRTPAPVSGKIRQIAISNRTIEPIPPQSYLIEKR